MRHAWCILVLLGCSRPEDVRIAEDVSGGSVERGAAAFRSYGCGTCHKVPLEQTAQGSVGPSLQGFALQSYLPGGLTNSPSNLTRWLEHPRQVEPKTAMPELGVSERDARDLAAYLYTLK